LKDTYDLVPIYERHAELTRLEQAQRIGAAAYYRKLIDISVLAAKVRQLAAAGRGLPA